MKGAPAAPRPPNPRSGLSSGGLLRPPPEPPPRKRRARPRALGAGPPKWTPLFLGKLGVRITDAFLASVALLVAELLVVGLLHRSEFISFGEAMSAGRLLPIAVVVAAPCALVVGSLVEAVAASKRPPARWIAALLATACTGALATAIVPSILGRRTDGGAGVRGLVASIAAAGGAGLVVWFGAPRLAAWCERTSASARWAVALALAVGGAAVAEVVGSAMGGSGEGAAAKGTTAGLAWCAAALVAAGFASLGRDPAGPRSGKIAPIGALVLFAVMAAVAAPAARSLASADNVRSLFARHAPTLGRTVPLAAEVAPPPPLDVALDAEAGAPGSLVDSNAVDRFQRGDVILVTVESVRADHLGAYGYERATSPHVDALARLGVVFEEAYTSTPNATWALASLMTGKYVRPLAQLGLVGGARDEAIGVTLAGALARYGYASAAFYPPSVFDTAPELLSRVAERAYDFGSSVVRAGTPTETAESVGAYLGTASTDAPLLLWAHLAAPNAPYRAVGDRSFGPRDVDRYDAEIAEVDEAVGTILRYVREHRPGATVIFTATSGEEFGDHGGHYHGTTVYDEQVRVPLIVAGPSMTAGTRVRAPVQTIDLLPTVLRWIDAPTPARARGRDLTDAIASDAGLGFAFAETDAMAMIAEDAFRLVCARRAGTCSLFNVRRDAAQARDVTGNHPEVVARLRALLTDVESSQGRYETRGEGEPGGVAWPEPLRRGIAGDGDAALDVAGLLGASSVEIRRRSAEVLFDLARPETTAALKGAISDESDDKTRAYLALALTRLGESAPLTIELLASKDVTLRRLAALALAELGDDRGEDELIRWWRKVFPDEAGKPREPLAFGRAKEILAAFARVKPKTAIVPIIDALADEALRPVVAKTLGDIGDEAARMPLSNRLLVERDQNTRSALLDALLRVNAGAEMVEPLVALLGLPDPLERGLEAAMKTDMLRHVGGPQGDHDTARLRRFATSGVAIDFYIPSADLDEGVRVVCLAKSDGVDGEIRVGRRIGYSAGEDSKAPVPKRSPELDPTRSMVIAVGASHRPIEVFGTAPASMDVHPGEAAHLVIYATQKVVVDACALVPLRSTIPTGRRRTK